ncbi:hypothetical protein [Pseudochelatococcus contaminans]|uniref:Uncharacterized protein n=1 Tax=Pseudochelatococcus contaminans TaxID=1538103 RepID=A0A7W5Z417_9HYPH|nr:hypothetical protein [Pseudochelatococcus contaminans]MBB3809712.1 hypothetical protein [Pseudochelatococcus contaminans]
MSRCRYGIVRHVTQHSATFDDFDLIQIIVGNSDADLAAIGLQRSGASIERLDDDPDFILLVDIEVGV